MKDIRKLAENHWAWLEPLLLQQYSPEILVIMKYLYITAMIHGWKHKEEECGND